MKNFEKNSICTNQMLKDLDDPGILEKRLRSVKSFDDSQELERQCLMISHGIESSVSSWNHHGSLVTCFKNTFENYILDYSFAVDFHAPVMDYIHPPVIQEIINDYQEFFLPRISNGINPAINIVLPEKMAPALRFILQSIKENWPSVRFQIQKMYFYLKSESEFILTIDGRENLVFHPVVFRFFSALAEICPICGKFKCSHTEKRKFKMQILLERQNCENNDRSTVNSYMRKMLIENIPKHEERVLEFHHPIKTNIPKFLDTKFLEFLTKVQKKGFSLDNLLSVKTEMLYRNPYYNNTICLASEWKNECVEYHLFETLLFNRFRFSQMCLVCGEPSKNGICEKCWEKI